MLLVIDNYDSFTFNLVQYFGELGEDVRVFRNDEIDVDGIGALAPDAIVLSPGPCTPAEAGVCVDAIRTFAGKLHVQAAAGVVADSDPQSEWNETQHKTRAILRAAEVATEEMRQAGKA